MDTKWMNGKLVVVPAALVMSLGLIGCKGEAEEPTAADATEQVDAAKDSAPAAAAPTAADTDAAKQAVDDAADATKDAVDDAAGGGG